MRLLTGRDSFTLTSCRQLELANYIATHNYKKLEPQDQIRSDELGKCISDELGIELIIDLPSFSLYQVNKSP
jgi:hypothetical protein